MVVEARVFEILSTSCLISDSVQIEIQPYKSKTLPNNQEIKPDTITDDGAAAG